MRFRLSKISAPLIIFLNCIVLYYIFRLIIEGSEEPQLTTQATTTKVPTKHISKLVSVLIREFEPNENDLTLTSQSFLNVFPNIYLFLVYDTLPYPPLDIALTNTSLSNVKLIDLSPSLKKSFSDRSPLMKIKTKYVLIVPDSVRLTSKQIILTMISLLEDGVDIVAVPSASSKKSLSCLRINVNLREWNIKFQNGKGELCDGVSGKHIALVKKELLDRVSNAFLLPFPHSLYIQTSAIGAKVKIIKNLSFHEGKPLFRSHHAQYKKKQLDNARMKKLYESLKIKQVFKENGNVEWYGCNREGSRCFGQVIDSMPSYLYEGKWTPPCCLANLRKTARHVFSHLDESGVRYWLDSGSLLGAMRSGDILPWDYDVDIGLYRDDIERSQWLKRAKSKPVIDNKGFLWEKATEGNFYRVYYSKTNRISVNLFPFYQKNGTMTKDWFTSHKNMEFPDSFLHPMSSIDFVGRSVPSPNNIRDFLEFKFGRGAVENPEYPDSSKLKFP